MPGPMMGGIPKGPRMGNSKRTFDNKSRVEESFDISKIEAESEEMMKLLFLTPNNAKFIGADGGFIDVMVGESKYEKVDIIRTFPFTEPFGYLSVRNPIDNSREIGIIRNLNEFDKETVGLIDNQLKIRYFTPVITSVISAKWNGGVVYMRVMTEYGECRFAFRTNNNAVTKLGENRILITDMDNNRYEIPDITRLPAKEQKKLDVLL